MALESLILQENAENRQEFLATTRANLTFFPQKYSAALKVLAIVAKGLVLVSNIDYYLRSRCTYFRWTQFRQKT